jgi:hypothetical protein
MSIAELRFLLLRKAKNKMATKKIVQGKEMYASKAKGGAVKKGAKSPAVALIIGMSKPKGKATMMNKGGMAKPMMYSKGGMAKGKK